MPSLRFASLMGVGVYALILANLLSASWAILPSVVDAPRNFLVDETTEAAGSRAKTPAVVVSEPVTPASSKKAETSSPKHQEKMASLSDKVPAGGAETSVASNKRLASLTQPLEKPLTGKVQQQDTLDEGIMWHHRALYQELRDEDEQALADIGMLWQTAIERSGTIRFAIEKLSRKNAVGDDPNDQSFAEQMIKQVARLGGVAGSMWTGSPAGMIGGNMVEEVLQDPKAGSPNLMRVTDADMVLLAKEVESLQGQLITTYYSYHHAQERLDAALKAKEELARYEALLPEDLQQRLTEGQMAPRAGEMSSAALVMPVVASVVANVQDATRQAQQDVASSRQALMLLVGPDAVQALEQIHNDPPATAAKANNA